MSRVNDYSRCLMSSFVRWKTSGGASSGSDDTSCLRNVSIIFPPCFRRLPSTYPSVILSRVKGDFPSVLRDIISILLYVWFVRVQVGRLNSQSCLMSLQNGRHWSGFVTCLLGHWKVLHSWVGWPSVRVQLPFVILWILWKVINCIVFGLKTRIVKDINALSVGFKDE